MPNRSSRLQSPDFRELFFSLPEAILVLLPDFTIVAATNACLRVLCIDRDSILGHDLFEVFPGDSHHLEPEAGTQLRNSIARTIKERVPDTITLRKIEPSQSAAAAPGLPARIWRHSSSPIAGAEGDTIYIIHRMEDLSGLSELEQITTIDPCNAGPQHLEQLQETRQNLDALAIEYENFAHSVSHDLRAPLRGIDMYAGVLKEDYHDRLDDEGTVCSN